MAQNMHNPARDRLAERQAALLAAAVPQDIAKQIDQEELGDRLVAATQLLQRARGATSPTVRGAYAEMAQGILKARPRAVTEAEVHTFLVKSQQAATPAERDRYRALAEEIKTDHPVAPRRRPAAARTVVKASTKSGTGHEMVPIYTATGQLVGVAPRSAIQPVAEVTADAVAKAHAAGRRAR